GLLPPHELADLRARTEHWAHLAQTHLAIDRLWPLLAAAPAPARQTDPIRAVLTRARLEWTNAASVNGASAMVGSAEPDTPAEPADCAEPFASAEPFACEAPVDCAEPVASRATQDGTGGEPPRARAVVIARDAAFHFLYPEVRECLEALGLPVRFWSPLADDPLPEDCAAVVLPGGYPELHAAALADAARSRVSLARASRRGVPIVAECGGLLLLGQRLVDPAGVAWPMAGVLPFEARPGSLSLGYRLAQGQRDGLLVRAGEPWRGHEFHRWQLHPGSPDAPGPSMWQLEGWGVERTLEGWTTPSLHASWLHIHWAGFPKIPLRLAAAIEAVAKPPRNGASWRLTSPLQRPTPSVGA
ncbi:MAG: hypothetical protein VKO26_02350, partial [Cyanobacteriota bacterium]|nr:hypothetical protein [Cyanobacteriota bacterium]